MAFRWRVDDGPTLKAGLGSFVIFQGSEPVLLRNPMCLWSFRRGPDPLPPPPLWTRAWPSYVRENGSTHEKKGILQQIHTVLSHVLAPILAAPVGHFNYQINNLYSIVCIGTSKNVTRNAGIAARWWFGIDISFSLKVQKLKQNYQWSFYILVSNFSSQGY